MDVGLSDKWLGTGAEYAVIVNGSGGARVVTLTFGANALVDGQAATAKTVSIPAGDTMIIGPFPPLLYNDSSGYTAVAYDAATSTKILVLSQGS